MANQTFADFFAGVRMTQLAEAALVKPGIPRVLPESFWTPGPTKPFDDKVQFPAVTFNRQGVPVVDRGSPPPAQNFGQTQWQFATIFNMKEEYDLGFDFLSQLFNNYAPVQQQAQMELNRRMIDFNQRVATTRTQMVQSLVANGKIWVGSAGQILASSSGAVITMDPGIPTGNQLTTNGAGSTYSVGDWSNPATDVQGVLRGIQAYNVRQNNYVLTNIVYGESVPTYLSTNTALAPYFARNPGFRDYLVANNEVPPMFLGFNWTPARLAYLVNSSGTPVQTFGASYLGLFPDVNSSWYEYVEGGTQIPSGVAAATAVNPGMSLEQYASNFVTRYGKYAYGVVKSYPIVGQSMVQGDCSGPVLKVPGTMYYGVCA